MSKQAAKKVTEAAPTSAELREEAASLLAEATQMDNDAAVAAQIAARKRTPGKMRASEISSNIQAQMDKRRDRDNKRKRDAMDAPTVNMQALEIIRKRTEPSTITDSGSVPTGDTDETNTAPDIPSPAEGDAPPAAAGSAGGAGEDAGVLQQDADGVDAGTDPVKPGPDGSGGEDNIEGNGGAGVSVQPFLQ